MPSLFSSEDIVSLQRKVNILSLIVLVFILIVLVRLFHLQVYRGSSYKVLSEQISVREEELRSRRGLILDRWGKVLADNRPYFEIVVIPQYMRNRRRTIESLSQLIPITAEEIKAKLHEARRAPPFMPVVLVEDAPYDWVAKIREYVRPDYDEEVAVYLEGVEVRASPLRLYLYPEIFSHAIGYLREIDKKTLKRYKKEYPDRYSMGDLIGANGIEWAYDLELRGHDGMRARVVDARGTQISGHPDVEILEERASFDPVDGNHIVTTLDFDAQMKAASFFENKRGAVVAIDPNTGEILVLYSSPGYDGNRIMKNIDKSYWQKINLHEDKFLYSRAVQAAYPPGSIYKIVPAFGGLDSGKITPETRFRCGGGLQFGNRFFKCWNKGGHGSVALLRGIAQSCDVYFYNVGLKLGVDGLHKYAHLLGLGERTGIEIPYENPGLIPSTEWKKKRYKQPWIESETLSIAIGQGYDLLTPLQAARMIAIVANGGHLFKPHLGKEILSPSRQTVKEISFPLGEAVIPEEILKLIQQGVIDVIHGAGTAKRLRASPYKIAGKTGTAQVIGHDSKLAMTARRKPHGWFVAYAPYDDPKIAIAVIVENGGSGGAVAGPVAMGVINEYLDKVIGSREKVAGRR